jgi:integration host factor subunit alpha
MLTAFLLVYGLNIAVKLFTELEEIMSLTKADIAAEISKKVGYTKLKSAELVNSIFELMKEELEDDHSVLISGFGKFSVRERGERAGRNPLNGEPIILPSQKVVTFACSGKLRNKINAG